MLDGIRPAVGREQGSGTVIGLDRPENGLWGNTGHAESVPSRTGDAEHCRPVCNK